MQLSHYIKNVQLFYNELMADKKRVCIPAILLALSIVCGYCFPAYFQEYIESNITTFAQELTDKPFVVIAVQLFIKNILVCFVLAGCGLALAIPTGAIIIVNGYVIGASIATSKLTTLQIIAYTVPHGIFEISGFILSAFLALKIAQLVWNNKLQTISLENYAKRFSYIAILIAIAAIIEAILFTTV